MLIAALIPCLLGYLIGKGFSSRHATHQSSAPPPTTCQTSAPAPAAPALAPAAAPAPVAPAPAPAAKSIWELSIAELEQKQADIFKALWK